MSGRDLIAIAFGLGYKMAGGGTLPALGWALGVRVVTAAIGVPHADALPQPVSDRAQQLSSLAFALANRNPAAPGAAIPRR